MPRVRDARSELVRLSQGEPIPTDCATAYQNGRSSGWLAFCETLKCGFLSVLKILVLCEYTKFRIESNSYFSIRFDLKRAQLFEILEYLPSPISYLFNRMTSIFHLSNHA